ncbi:hypothetical protein OAC14_00370 [Candidatus Pelagibacter sp.]|nr:hypothetical protein [Candidatus Pelagibacter sp.]
MSKKTIIQILMILLIVFISLWFYSKYFKNNPEISADTSTIGKKDININRNNFSTYIDDINYVSSDLKNNKYQITAKKAEIKIENSDIMFFRKRHSQYFNKKFRNS